MTISVPVLKDPLGNVTKFRLNPAFINVYKTTAPDFGFNGLGEATYLRTYSRVKGDGTKEEWWETVRRVVEGTYTIQKKHILQNNLYWDEEKAQNSAQKMYRYIFTMKFLPPGRGLWAMGTDIIEKKGLYEALNNCAFVSTQNIYKDFAEPFTFMMDGSMLGIGVGFDVKGAGKVIVHKPGDDKERIFTIPDSREGWVNSLRLLLESYASPAGEKVIFDYSQIRPAGAPLKVFGGHAAGHQPPEKLLGDIRIVLDSLDQQPITERAIVDIMNMIGRCVIAGNVRRTAQIAFGKTKEFCDLKNYELNPERLGYGWASNNSVEAGASLDYAPFVENTKNNGEPGYFWLENARKYGRMGINSHEKYMADDLAAGGNPCLEQTLEHMEMCCLVETFPYRCESKEEFLDVLKYAYLYAKTVTLGRTHWPKTNDVMLRNRRIGTSLSGIAQFIEKNSLEVFRQWCDEGYRKIQEHDKKYSSWFKIPLSIKTTSIKPSGTVSLLAGATPGIHYPESRYYIRRMNVANNDPLIEYLKEKGVQIEPLLEFDEKKGAWIESETTSKAIFYIDCGFDKVAPSMWEQLNLAAFLQEWWADNQVSVTVSFDPETEGKDLVRALEYYQYRLKGVSFLPRRDLSKIYKQLPYEAITKEGYGLIIAGQKEIGTKGNGNGSSKKYGWNKAVVELYCDSDQCEILPLDKTKYEHS